MMDGEAGLRGIRLRPCSGDMRAPRSMPMLKSLSRSHVHAQTVKNRSSCNSKACCPNEDNIEEKEPWVN